MNYISNVSTSYIFICLFSLIVGYFIIFMILNLF
nr:MAG TPA: mannose-6-phosphate receptor [Bacteriophage sp.]